MAEKIEKTPYAAVIGEPRNRSSVHECRGYFSGLEDSGVLGKAEILLPSQKVVLRETFEESRAFRTIMGDDKKLWSIADNWLTRNGKTRECPVIFRARVLDLKRCAKVIPPFKERGYGLDFKLYPSSFDDGNGI